MNRVFFQIIIFDIPNAHTIKKKCFLEILEHKNVLSDLSFFSEF